MKFILNLTGYTCGIEKRGFSSVGFNFGVCKKDFTTMHFNDLKFCSFSSINNVKMFLDDLKSIISSLDGKNKLDFYLYTFTNEDIDFLDYNIPLESIHSSSIEFIQALMTLDVFYKKKGYLKVYTYYFNPGESIDDLIHKVHTNLGEHTINTSEESSDVDSYTFFIANTVLQITSINIPNSSFNFNKLDKRFYSTKTSKSKNVLFSKLKNIINNYPINEDTQRLIEEVTVDNNIHRLDKNIKFHDILGDLNLKAKKELINNSDTLKILIDNFVNRDLSDYSRKRNSRDLSNYFLNLILKELGTDYAVSVLLGKTIAIINMKDAKSNHSTSVFVELGTYFVNNYFYSLYKKEQKVKILKKDNNYKMWDWRADNIKLINRINTPIIHGIGALLFDWLREIDLLTLNVVKSDGNNKELISVIEPSDKLKSYLIEQKNKPLPLPNKLPMIVKPKPYIRYTKNNKICEELGGYLLNGERYWNEIIIKNWRSKENSQIKDVNIVYNTVNKLSSVKYKINKDVLNFIRLNDKKYNLTLINKTHPLETEAKLTKWEKLELESFSSKKNVENSILEIADLFENIDGFYMPTRLDYRGRIYCDVDYLNYQGTDLAKCLLMFSEGSKVLKSDDESINYLKMYGANCFSNKLSKKSGVDRINWVDENINNIRNYDNGILISQSDNKFLFVGFCIEYNKLLNSLDDNNNPYFITHLPIQLDASCNGFQHISMLIQDLSLAQALNLTDKTYNDIPDDFYSLIGLYLKEYFFNKIASQNKNEILSDKEIDSYTRLSKLDIQRDIIKKAIMTLPYNASSIQLIAYLKSEFEYDTEKNLNNKKGDKVIWYKYKKNSSIKLKSDDFIYIYHGLKFILSQVFPSFTLLSEYFIKIAKICSKLGITIPWYLPSGLIVNQSYLEVKTSRVKPLNFSNLTFSLKILKNKLHKDKQIRALMPNIIHSLDSLSLMILINKYFDELKSNNPQESNIYTIHDCIAVTFNDMKETINLLKIAYINIYSDEGYLLKMHKGFVEHIKNYLGDKFNEEDLTIEINTETKSNKIKKEILKLPDVNEVIKGTYKIKTLVNSVYILN